MANRLKSSFSRLLLAALLLTGVSTRAWALPLGGDGSYYYSGGANSSLNIAIDASNQVLQHYTIGLYNLDLMTAGQGDPDFQIQALQADRVILLQEFGKAGAGELQIALSKSAHFGLFLLRDASLRDFSTGQNAYRPIFSTAGAPGSHLLQFAADGANGVSFSFQSFLGTIGVSGAVGIAGLGDQGPSSDLTVHLAEFQPPIFEDENPTPVVPEPATLAMIGLGISLAGAMRRRPRNV